MPGIRINLFSVFIFLGIIQAIILSVFFLRGQNRKSPFNYYQGLLLLAITAVILEIFLMSRHYTLEMGKPHLIQTLFYVSG